MPMAPAIENVPVIAVTLNRNQVSVIAPAVRVTQVAPAVVIGPKVARDVAPANDPAVADSSFPVTVVPGVPRT
jgi:hypothetical protein